MPANAEISYVLVTPYTILKSRTGGLIGRLLSEPGHDLIGVTMLSLGQEFLDAYAATYEKTDLPKILKKELIEYIRTRFLGGERMGISNRAMLLLFKSAKGAKSLREDAIGKLEAAAGGGNSLRGIYGDYIHDRSGNVLFFEPAVLTGVDRESNREQLKLFLDAGLQGTGLVEQAVTYPKGAKVETTLVILKPENFVKRSSRAGGIITTFSRTGLNIVGARLLHLTLAQAQEFYGPLMDIFRKKLRFKVADAVQKGFVPALGYTPSAEENAAIQEVLAERNARYEFNKILQFMSGLDPDKVKPEDVNKPGEATCLALLYRGVNAVDKIRERLGATDPNKAETGTVRAEFASSLMINSAHASDSSENATRERKIIGLYDDDGCDCRKLLKEYLG